MPFREPGHPQCPLGLGLGPQAEAEGRSRERVTPDRTKYRANA